MKKARFSSVSTRAAAVSLVGLLLASGAAGQFIKFSFKKKSAVKVTYMGLAQALARQVGEVRQRFDASRRALRTVPGPGGAPAYPREEVAGLIARTEKDLDQAIEQVGDPGLDGLRAWAAEELRHVQEELAAPSGPTAASAPGLSCPRAVAVIASLGSFPEPASVSAAAPRQDTIAAEKSNRLLDQVGAVVGRIFALAERNDLEVELWVGSTPAPQVMFNFWPQGKVKGARQAPRIMRTNGKRDRVLRGLYYYRAAWTKGPVTELIEYPSPAGGPVERSERLDLVGESRFFCCYFNEQSCRHVDNENDCQP